VPSPSAQNTRLRFDCNATRSSRENERPKPCYAPLASTATIILLLHCRWSITSTSPNPEDSASRRRVDIPRRASSTRPDEVSLQFIFFTLIRVFHDDTRYSLDVPHSGGLEVRLALPSTSLTFHILARIQRRRATSSSTSPTSRSFAGTGNHMEDHLHLWSNPRNLRISPGRLLSLG